MSVRSRFPSLALFLLWPLLCLGVGGWLRHADAVQALEWKTVDLRFALRGPLPPDPEILIIAVDEKTFRALGIKYPFPPLLYARLIEKLNTGGAAVIAFDFLYSEPTRECDPPGQDALLAGVVGRSGNVVWACELQDGKTPLLPILPIREAAAGVGYINMPDEVDGRMRRAVLRLSTDGGVVAFSQAIVERYAGFFPPGWEREAPQTINFRGPAGTFPAVSMADVLQDRVPGETFRNRICLVGAAFAASHDVFPTPFHDAARPDTPGIEIQANIIGNVLRGDILRTAPGAPMWGLLLLVLPVLSLLFHLGRPWAALGLWLAASGGWAAWSLHRFIHGSIEPLAFPLLILGGVFWTQLFGTHLLERKRRREIKDLFSSYVDPAVVNLLLKHPAHVNLRGDRRTVTILNTDIEGFTTLMSSMDPEPLVEHLNLYFETLTEIALSAGGMYDKFKGDALMVVYGFPEDQPDHARRAVEAGRNILAAVDRLNAEWQQRGLPVLKTRVGICSGEVIMGNVGGTRRKSFTAMGDAANLSARLEALNKTLGTRILIAESTAAFLPDGYPMREIGEVEVRGYARPLRVYTLD